MVDIKEIVGLLKEADEKILEQGKIISEQQEMINKGVSDIQKEASYSINNWGGDGMGFVATEFNDTESPTDRMCDFFNN